MRKPLRFTVLVAVTGVALSACALDDDSGGDVEGGSLSAEATLEGASFSVGSKEFTEQLVLCEITALALESAGAAVDRNCGLTGSNTVRSALTSGDIDMYWEYTGTGWITHLKETTPLTDARAQYDAVAKADLEKNDIVWLEPSPADNTYAVAASKETAEALGVTTVSDYAELANSDPGKASFCGAAEFFGREDGWPGLQKAYGFDLPRGETAELDLGVVYSSVDKSEPCNFGEVFATDGRIAAMDLTVLEDDKGFFPVYNPSLTVRNEVMDESPEVADVMAPVSEALDDTTLRRLNAEVDVDGKTPEQVAEDWMTEKGFIG